MREEPPGLTLADDPAGPIRSLWFVHREGNRLADNDTHDIRLPGLEGTPVGFLMCPHAEVVDGRPDNLGPDNFTHRIVSREIAS